MPFVRSAVLWLMLLLASMQARGEGGRIAITVDDLPWATLAVDDGRVGPPDLAAQHAALMAGLRARPLPVTGFVNAGKLVVDGAVDPARLGMLRDWLEAGAELGNHTWGHIDLHAVGVEAFCADVARGDPALRGLLAERGVVPRWFRHPYLRAGRTAEDKQAVVNCLAALGYRVAPVTVDNSDWIWARAYRRCLDAADRCDGALERLRADYVPYLLAKLDYYDRQARELLGGPIPQVLLLHANELNAATWTTLIDALAARRWQVVALEDVLQHAAYSRSDGYFGAYGPSWIHRWAMADGRKAGRYGGEPATPQWVLVLAGVDGE